MSTATNAANAALRAGAVAAAESRWVAPPVRAARLHRGAPASGTRLLTPLLTQLHTKTAVAMRAASRFLEERGLPALRSVMQASVVLAGSVAHGGAGLLRGSFGSTSGPATRQLAVEERLTLGPKQHLYLVRCGEHRLLVASAGEAALQWMTMPEAQANLSQKTEGRSPGQSRAKTASRSRNRAAGRRPKQECA